MTMRQSNTIFKSNQNILSNIDWYTLALYLALALIGWLSVYAAVYDEQHQSIFDLSQRYGKQLLWIGMALLLGFIIILLDPKFFVAFAWLIYAITILLLLAVLFFWNHGCR